MPNASIGLYPPKDKYLDKAVILEVAEGWAQGGEACPACGKAIELGQWCFLVNNHDYNACVLHYACIAADPDNEPLPFKEFDYYGSPKTKGDPLPIRKLGDIDDVPAELYGGKAAALHLLKKSGVPVPDGLAIGHTWSKYDNELLYDIGSRINKMCITQGLPLSAFPIMVRSSAVAEDGKASSFAGRYETISDVYLSEIAHLAQAMGKVKKSADTGRAKKYAKRRGADSEEANKIGIVVQQQIIPLYAAILFTRHPMGEEGAYVEVIEGHGEELVSGKKTPLYAGRPEDAPAEYELNKLAQLSELCTEIIGCPADVEAAHDGRQWWIVQARPITTLTEK